MTYWKEGLDIAEETHWSDGKITALEAMADAHLKQGKTARALDLYTQALDLAIIRFESPLYTDLQEKYGRITNQAGSNE